MIGIVILAWGVFRANAAARRQATTEDQLQSLRKLTSADEIYRETLWVDEAIAVAEQKLSSGTYNDAQVVRAELTRLRARAISLRSLQERVQQTAAPSS